MGQILPGQANYNFKGVMDNVSIFDYALTPEAVKIRYENGITAINEPLGRVKMGLVLSPNPVTDLLTLNLNFEHGTQKDDAVKVQVFDMLGRLVLEQNNVLGSAVVLDVRGCGSGIYRVFVVGDGVWGSGVFLKV
jgi:hypothetical protein